MTTLITPINNFESTIIGMKKREVNNLLANELYLDIISFMSILYKMGFDESVDNEVVLVAMLNEAGFKTVQGHDFTIMSYRNFMKRVNVDTVSHVKNVLQGNI